MSKTNNRLRYTVFAVSDPKGKPSRFTPIGAAFDTKDQTGIVIQLDALPPNGRLVCLPPKEVKPAPREE